MAEKDIKTQIIQLLREAGHAHHQAFIETDGADPDWPIWYAGHLRDKLGPLLNASFTQSELTYLLILVEKEQSMRAPGGDWPRYYAKFFMERYL